jgi:hypothetical protein
MPISGEVEKLVTLLLLGTQHFLILRQGVIMALVASNKPDMNVAWTDA